MGIGSISFWQQDQNYWSQVQQSNQSSSASSALITDMSNLMINQARGLATIANQEALTRTNTALSAAIQSLLNPNSATSSSTSSATSSSAASSAPSVAQPATGTGSVPLSSSTSLLTLGIPPNGSILVGDGTNTTTYTSTGSDTVGDLINAINTPGVKNAQVKAYLDSSGHIVLTAENTTDTISVSGLFAQNIGFGSSNDSFQPVAAASTSPPNASSSSSSSSNSSTSSASSSSSNTSSSSTGSTAIRYNSSIALQTGSSAASLLSQSGVGGSLVDLLA
jgi:hypothetical protein